jgi:hypothetical protein
VRRRLAPHIALLVLAVLAALAASPPTAAGAQLAGVQTHLLWSDVDGTQLARQLDLARESGATLTRVDVGWASLQQTRPETMEAWYLARLDRLVAAAEARGIRLLLTFMNTPCWASTAPEELKRGCSGQWWTRDVTAYAPADPAAYGRALAFLVRRYGTRVAAWELWNEPNLARFWRAPRPAEAYAQLVRAAYAAAKAADPRVRIVAGALSQSDTAFATELYRNGLAGHFDAFSIHPYSEDASPLARRDGGLRYSFVRGVPAVHDVMTRHGDHRPLWLTEAGWSTSTARTAEPWRNGVSEARQASYLCEAYAQVRRWPWVGALVWFNLQDAGADRAALEGNFGLRRVDGSAKPAWRAFRDAARRLGDTRSPGAAPSPDCR